MKSFAKANLKQVLDLLATDSAVWVPAEIQDGCTAFVSYSSDVEPSLTANSTRSPKAVLLPAAEKVYRYDFKGKEVTVTPLEENNKTVLFAVRSCDVAAIAMLDDVFLGVGNCDAAYEARRRDCTIVALGCIAPADGCFCSSMGIDPRESLQADAQLYDLGDRYGLVARNEAGQAIAAKIDRAGLLEDAAGPILEPVGEFARTVDTTGVAEKLNRMFGHELWEDIARKCIGCGACAHVCPTCHCFDLVDVKKNARCGYKIRTWDSCQFGGYTLMAGGHNPRPGKKERMRQRFMHKLCYGPARQGKMLCTGCGRCLAVCPVNIEITEIIGQVREANIDG